MRILVVEDDVKIGGFLERGLAQEGHTVDLSRTGADALRRVDGARYDLLLLDLMLPGVDGRAVLARVRAQPHRTPVIVLTALSTVEDRVRGLDEGADDYLVKPFSFVELLARIRAVSRRASDRFEPVIHLGDLQLDTVKHRLEVSGEPIELTPREYQLLEYFMRHPGQTLSRAMLTDRVWGLDFDPGSNVVDVYVAYLRKKLATSKLAIRTIRGFGYALEGEFRAAPA